jgi:hypothetical protein
MGTSTIRLFDFSSAILPRIFRSTLPSMRNFRGFSHVHFPPRTTLQDRAEMIKCLWFKAFLVFSDLAVVDPHTVEVTGSNPVPPIGTVPKAITATHMTNDPAITWSDGWVIRFLGRKRLAGGPSREDDFRADKQSSIQECWRKS